MFFFFNDTATTEIYTRKESVTDLATTIPAGIDTALPAQVAPVLGTTPAGLAQMRYKGTGPKFIKSGHRVLYRWSDIRAYLDANTVTRSGDPREGI